MKEPSWAGSGTRQLFSGDGMVTHLAAVACVCYSRVGQLDTDRVKGP